MRIDSNGNLLVGTTTYNGPVNASSGDYGAAIWGGGLITAGTNSSETLALNRMGSNGDIAVFKRSGSTKGSIGVSNDGASFGNATQHVAMHSGKLFPASPTHSSLDNTIDLGYSAGRFRNAYLSGGIYLGGTGSANKLDDYEEGTWTITDGSGGGITFGFTHNRYTKIGRLVMAHVRLQFPTTSNTSLARVNLPFTADANSNSSATGGVVTEQNYDSSICLTACINDANRVLFRNNGVTSLTNAQLSGKLLRFTVTYNAT